MTRRFSRIRSSAALALAVTAVAAPAAIADTPVASGWPGVDLRAFAPPVVGDPVGDRYRDAPAVAPQVVGDPVGDRYGVNDRREAPPIFVSAPPLAQATGFDWLDAGIGASGLALLLLVGTGTAKTLRTRRGLVRAA